MKKKKTQEKRKENIIFTIWVHTGYTVLILSVIGWMIYMEFFMDYKKNSHPMQQDLQNKLLGLLKFMLIIEVYC